MEVHPHSMELPTQRLGLKLFLQTPPEEPTAHSDFNPVIPIQPVSIILPAAIREFIPSLPVLTIRLSGIKQDLIYSPDRATHLLDRVLIVEQAALLQIPLP